MLSKQQDKNKAINEKTICNTIIHQNYVTGNNPSGDISSGLPSNNSSIEPSDQPSTTSIATIVVKKGMHQLPVPLLVDEYPSAINW